jgi:hypothetical protein
MLADMYTNGLTILYPIIQKQPKTSEKNNMINTMGVRAENCILNNLLKELS